MPIYEYQCEACGHRLEKLQKVSDDLLKDCPSCHEASLSKLVSAAAFRLKGSGWYETDFKKGAKKNLVEGDKTAPSGSGSTDKKEGGKSSESSSNSTDSSKNVTNNKSVPAPAS